MTSRRVVVTGMGALTPIGNDLDSYWNGLLSGTSGCAEITHFDAAKFKTKFACELKTSIFWALVILGINSILTKLIFNLEHAFIKSRLLKGSIVPSNVEFGFNNVSSSSVKG